MRRVVITGIGAVTPLGNDIETTWKCLTEKRSGIGLITKFDPSGLTSRIAGELKYFPSENYISKKEIQRLDPFIHYAIAAATMAAEDAGLISAEARKHGSAIASVGAIHELPATDSNQFRRYHWFKQGRDNKHGKRPAKASVDRQTLLSILNVIKHH